MTFILELTVAIYLALLLFSASLCIIFPWLGNKLMSAYENASERRGNCPARDNPPDDSSRAR